jgi:hypothetical protein
MDKIDKWYVDRWSKFTSSENYKLITPSKPNEIWSTGANTYIEQKAVESVTNFQERYELEEVKSLLWGKAHEYPAYESYIQTTRNYSMQYTGTDNPMFLVYDKMPEESGGTPDAVSITSSNKVDVGCEIKCPKNSIEHFRRLRWTSQWDVKEGYKLVYTQIQHLMMITGAQEWHFISFDDRQLYKSNKTKIIEVKPDQKFMDNLEVKLTMAVKEKYKILSDHLGSQVKCKSDLDKLIK